MARTTIRAATRSSALARWQADHVAALLGAAHPGVAVEMVLLETTGDRRGDVPIHQMGGQGVFVKEVQAAVLDGRADIAVHSAKDLPSTTAAGLRLACVPERGNPLDALVGVGLGEMAAGSLVATGSVRRRAQLAHLRPDLVFTDLRGNIATRLGKLPIGGALVMAAAALERLELTGSWPVEELAPEVMVPQAGQGALAVECRADDDEVAALLVAVEHGPSRWLVDVERAFLAELGSGCDLPVGVHARDVAGGVEVRAFAARPDGSTFAEAVVVDPDAALATARDLAHRSLVAGP